MIEAATAKDFFSYGFPGTQDKTCYFASAVVIHYWHRKFNVGPQEETGRLLKFYQFAF